MNGRHYVQISNKLVDYQLTLDRKITVITGDSGIGKTSMIKNLRRGISGGSSTKLNCTAGCDVISGSNWYRDISNRSGYILFFDESALFVRTGEFVSLMRQSDNYFVLVNRSRISSIPYSMDAVFTISTTGRKSVLAPLYPKSTGNFTPTFIITEDGRTGYSFFLKVCNDNHQVCYAARGKSKIKETLQHLQLSGEKILLFVDASAFGPEAASVLEYIRLDTNNSYYLFAPESFEQLILLSDMFKSSGIIDRVMNPSQYIQDNQLSWEEYFTHLLSELVVNTPAVYSKRKSLNRCYVEDCCYRTIECKFCARGDKIQMILGEYASLFDFSRINGSGSNVLRLNSFS